MSHRTIIQTCHILPLYRHVTSYHYTDMLHPTIIQTCHILPLYRHITSYHYTDMLHPTIIQTCHILPLYRHVTSYHYTDILPLYRNTPHTINYFSVTARCTFHNFWNAVLQTSCLIQMSIQKLLAILLKTLSALTLC